MNFSFNLSSIYIVLIVFLFFPLNKLNCQNQKNLIDTFYNAKSIDSTVYYGRTYLKNAQNEKDTLSIYTGYALLASIYEYDKCTVYADSLIRLTEKKSGFYYPAIAYIHKANYYITNSDYSKTIDNLILAKEYGETHKNENIISQCNELLGMVRIKMGDPKSAIELFQQNISKSKIKANTKYSSNYLTDIYNLASVYNEIQAIDSANYYNSLGRKISKLENDQFNLRYFNFNNSITKFYEKKYNISKDSLINLLPFLKKERDYINIIESYYYLGKINSFQGNQKKAVEYFSKIDSTFKNTNQFYPKFKDSYYELIKYASANNQKKLQLQYINKLLAIDSIILIDDLYINNRISTELEIPALIKDKEELINNLSKKNSVFKSYIFWIIILLIFSLIVLSYQFYSKHNYKKQAKKLIDKLNLSVDTFVQPKVKIESQNNTLEIPQDQVAQIIKKLEKFEIREGYLDSNLSLTKLAKNVRSNTKYLSKIINEYKGLSYSEYINGLRIQSAIKRLKNEKHFKNYTIKAVAQESGFNQAESFAKAFYKVTKVKPSYFIKELKKLD